MTEPAYTNIRDLKEQDMKLLLIQCASYLNE